DYEIMVGGRAATRWGSMISRRSQPVPVYHALLQQDHVHLPSGEARRESGTLTASDVMDGASPYVNADQSVAAALTTVRAAESEAGLVGTADGVIGIVTADLLRSAVDGGRGAEPVGALAEGLGVHTHPDHGLDVVFDRLVQSRGALPVVDREHVKRVVGVVTLPGLVRRLGPRV